MRYWLGIDSPAVYEDYKNKYKLAEARPFGFPKARQAAVRETQVGDRVINYITDYKRFYAVCEIIEKQVTDNDYILDGTAYPECVKVTPLTICSPEDGILVYGLLDQLEIAKSLPSKRHWGVLVKTGAREWPLSDGEMILRKLKDFSA
jgi:EVE domain-containing protein